MPKVVLTCQIQDPIKWEAGFRTHGDVFRTYNLQAPVNFSVTGNEVVLCMEPADLGAFKKAMESPATAEAMAFDGVKRETVKMFVLDKEVKV
jgi:carotenoid cleavage dioxygenase-like enzyme